MLPIDGKVLSEHQSSFAFDQTVDRLSEAIIKAGMQLFAVIDHAANARAAGLEMPPSTVLIYGKAEGGTMIMLASPASALDLPLRVLVRQDADGRTIMAFHPVAPMLETYGIPASVAARLKPAQDLLCKAITR
jgi:uncharacterized protein (DUF302 family)